MKRALLFSAVLILIQTSGLGTLARADGGDDNSTTTVAYHDLATTLLTQLQELRQHREYNNRRTEALYRDIHFNSYNMGEPGRAYVSPMEMMQMQNDFISPEQSRLIRDAESTIRRIREENQELDKEIALKEKEIHGVAQAAKLSLPRKEYSRLRDVIHCQVDLVHLAANLK